MSEHQRAPGHDGISKRPIPYKWVGLRTDPKEHERWMMNQSICESRARWGKASVLRIAVETTGAGWNQEAMKAATTWSREWTRERDRVRGEGSTDWHSRVQPNMGQAGWYEPTIIGAFWQSYYSRWWRFHCVGYAHIGIISNVISDSCNVHIMCWQLILCGVGESERSLQGFATVWEHVDLWIMSAMMMVLVSRRDWLVKGIAYMWILLWP
jgi:hypothetical protein